MIHVYPLNDLREHTTEGTVCDCLPRVVALEELMVIHNSFDGREFLECDFDSDLCGGAA